MSVSAVEEERVGLRRALLQRWKKNVLVMFLMCDLKERVGFWMMLRFRTEGEEVSV